MKEITLRLPDYQADAVDRIRQYRRVSRSHVIRQALDVYLASPEARAEAERIYEAGYRAIPEDPHEAEAFARMAAELLGPEDWD